jgi:hypothetical protein
MSTENTAPETVTSATESAAPAAAAPAPAAAPSPSSDRPQREHRGGQGGFRGQGGNRGPGGHRGPRRDNRDKQPQEGDGPTMIEMVVFFSGCAVVVKGGRRFSCAALAGVGEG